MKKVVVNLEPYLPTSLEKDLMEGEDICPTCKGLGMVVANNVYGLQGEKHPSGKHFPYQKQAFMFCPTCYNGVVKRCKFCGAVGNKQYTNPEYSCTCEEAKKQREESNRQKAIEKWDKTKKVTLSEAIEQFEMIFIDGAEKYLPPDELEEWIDDKRFDDPEWEPGYIYGTKSIQLVFNVGDIVSSCCEELHEEAEDQISNDAIAELQELMNKWLDTYASGTTTYCPDFSVGILYAD